MKELCEEWKAQMTEGVFNHRWILLETYHNLGEDIIIRGYEARTEEIAREMGIRAKDVHYAVQLAKLYPNLDSLPLGKNMSWYKVCKDLPPYEKNPPKKEGKAKD